MRRLGLIILVQVVRHRARLDRLRSLARNNMPEVAFLASHLLWMTKRQEIVALYDMITSRAAAANLGNYGLKVGCPANLVVLDQQSVAEVLRLHAPPAAIGHEPLVEAKKMRELPSLNLADFWPENPPFC